MCPPELIAELGFLFVCFQQENFKTKQQQQTEPHLAIPESSSERVWKTTFACEGLFGGGGRSSCPRGARPAWRGTGHPWRQQRRQEGELTARSLPALGFGGGFLPIHLGFGDRSLFSAPPVGLLAFFFVSIVGWRRRKKKIPGDLLCRVINIGALSGKVGVRISQSSALAKGEVGGAPQTFRLGIFFLSSGRTYFRLMFSHFAQNSAT